MIFPYQLTSFKGLFRRIWSGNIIRGENYLIRWMDSNFDNSEIRVEGATTRRLNKRRGAWFNTSKYNHIQVPTNHKIKTNFTIFMGMWSLNNHK